MLGLDIDFTKKDFSINSQGKIDFLTGKDLVFRNFSKILRTESGDLTEVQDSRTRYNPQYGLDYSRMYDRTLNLSAAAVNVKQEVERVCRRFIENQKVNLQYMGEDEVISRYVVVAIPSEDNNNLVEFNILLWTIEDVRLGRSPSFNQTYST